MASGAGDSANFQRQRQRLRRLGRLAAAALVFGSAAAAAGAAMPPPGRHVGWMCVHAISAPLAEKDCGTVELWLLRNDLVVVRISDIAYRLVLHPDAIDIVLMHGAMQIDAFTTLYRWQDATLHFDDRDKGMRYQIDFAPATRRQR